MRNLIVYITEDSQTKAKLPVRDNSVSDDEIRDHLLPIHVKNLAIHDIVEDAHAHIHDNEENINWEDMKHELTGCCFGLTFLHFGPNPGTFQIAKKS